MHTILGRTITVFTTFFLLLAGALIITLYYTNLQKNDGLILTLAARQSMLSQKMTKEAQIFFDVAKWENQKELARWKEQLILTINLFETTLFTLKNGGAAPVNMRMTKFRDIPSASPAIEKELDKITGQWVSMGGKLKKLIDSGGKNEAALNYIIANNMSILAGMEKIVLLMQDEAEKKVYLMIRMQGLGLAISFFIVIIGIIRVKMTVVKPIKNLINAAESMSTGNLRQEIKTSGLKEITELSASLNRMRIRLVKMMDRLK